MSYDKPMHLFRITSTNSTIKDFYMATKEKSYAAAEKIFNSIYSDDTPIKTIEYVQFVNVQVRDFR